MSARKPSSIATKIVATFAIAALSLSLFAGRYWLGATDDALFSKSENWASSSENGSGGKGKPDTSTSTTYFYTYKNGLIVFDEAATVANSVCVSTQNSIDKFFVWQATALGNGISAPNNDFQLANNGTYSPAYLHIEGGTYSFGTTRIGYADNATAYLKMTGGDFTANKARVGGGKTGVNGTLEIKGGVFSAVATGEDVFMVCDQANTKGTLIIEGGTLNTTNGNQVCIGGVDEIDAQIYVNTGGVWNAKRLILGGKRAQTYSVTNSVTKIEVNGGTLNLEGENGIGYANGDGSYAEMVVNDGAVNCNYGYFYVAEQAAGGLTINGGTFTMTSNSDGGLTFGRNTTEPGILTLNGGVLATSKLRLDKLSKTGSQAIFNGGTLKALNATTSFINNSEYITCVIKDGGLVVDTDGYDITIKHDFVDEDGTPASSSTKIGTITKKGKGKLTLSSSSAFPAEKIIVEKGTVYVSANDTTYEPQNDTSTQSRYWLGATQDTLVSDTANWSSEEGGSAGASSIDDDYLGAVYFAGVYTTGAAVFNSAVELAKDVNVGAATATPLTWSATDAANGFLTSGNWLLGYDASHAAANLEIDSGTYSSGYIRIGNVAEANAEVVQKGGAVTVKSGRVVGGGDNAEATLAISNGTFTVTESLYVLSGANTGGDAKLILDGGTLVTTAPDYVRIGESGTDATALMQVKSGTWNTKSFLVGGQSKKTANNNRGVVATLQIDGGTVNVSADSSIGANVGEGARSEMIINGGTVNINANMLYVGDGGPGYLTVNGGELNIKDTADYGIGFGHVKNDGTGSDLAHIVLNGGTVTMSKFRMNYLAPGSTLVFNGGVLKATRDQTSYLDDASGLVCEIAEGGLIFDTNGHDVTIAHDLTGVGGIVKRGLGTLTLSGNNSFTGAITVEAGSVDTGSGSQGVTDDPSSYTTTLAVTEGGADLGTVQLHRSPLSFWLADEDFETYTSTYGAQGTASKETPRYIAVEANGVTNTYMNLNTSSNVTGTVGGLAYSFTTEDVAPRTLRLDYSSSGRVANVRDVGSWPLETLDGKKMKQDVILRGGHLDGFASADAATRTAGYLTQIGLKTEIDLRIPGLDNVDSNVAGLSNGDASFAADGCTYYRFGLGWGTGDGTQIGADNNGNFTNQIRNVFATWGAAGNLPSYFHCQIGTDRTGVTGLLLLGLMGVEEEVLYRDYLMSNFANIGGSRSSAIPEQFIRYILRGNCNDGKYVYNTKDAQYGVSVASRCRQYLEMCGVTSEEIGVITAALSGETPAEVLARVDAYETANNYRTVSYVSYEGSSTTNAIHRFGTNGKRILPRSTPTRDGYTFLGWDVDNESVYDETTGDSVVYALWKDDSVKEPHTYVWDNNAGTSTLADGGNWYVENSDPKVYNLPTAIDEVKIEESSARPVLNEGETFDVKTFYVGRNSSSYPVLDVTNGTIYVEEWMTLGRYGGRTEMNVYDGEISAKQLTVGNWGSHDYNQLNIYGGTVTARGGNWPCALALGLQTESRGDILIKGGTLVSLNTVKVGFSNLSNIGGPSATYNSSITVDGGLFCVTGSVDVADSDSGDGGGGGRIYVNSGAMTVSSDLNISQSSNSWGQVDVFTGGSLTVDGTIRVGNNKYAQHAVLNVAGGTVDVKSLSVARECDGYVYVTDGGTIYAESIDKSQSAPSTAHPYFYFDDANIVAKSGYAYTFASSSGITLGAGGLVFDTNGYSPTIQAFTSIDGIGGLTKKGEGTLTLVANSFGFAGAYNAHGVISVEQGTLKMPSGQTFYVEGTDVAEGATLDLNGSELVLVTKKIDGSVWTNASGDRNAANPVNWSTTVKYYGEDGREIESIRTTLDGVLPTSESDVRIPIDSVYPTNLDPASVKSVTYVSSRDMSLIVDFATTYDNYAAPSLALSGDVKVLNNFNGLLNSAVGWYDPSDVSTRVLNGDGTVNGLVNKGTLGSVLDFEPMGDTSAEKTMPIIERADGWKLDSISFATTNRGFKTSVVSALAGDKTLIGVDRHVDGEWYPFLANRSGTFGWIGAIEVFGSLFRYYVNGGDDWGETLNMNGAPGTSGKNRVHSFRVASKAIKAEFYYAADGSLYTGSTDVLEDLVSENMRLCMGERSWWNGTAQHGYVGESLAFDSALSDAATTAVRQYLAAKWLEGDAVAPSAGTTVFDALILEGANVDMDGAAVSVGILGGDGSIANCTSLRITEGFACDVDGSGNAPKIVVDCDVDATGTTAAELSDALSEIVNGGTVATLVETTGRVTMPSRIRIKHGAHDYVIYKAVSGEKAMICLAKDLGFTIRLR